MSDSNQFPGFSGSGGPSGSPPPPPRPVSPGGSGGGPPSPGRGLVFGLIVGMLVLALGAVVLTGRGGIVEVADTEVGVIVNYISGETELVATPGYRIFLPFFSQAFTFDKSPNKFLMEGEKDRHANHVRKLTVRAKDGSNFWFETLEIQYQLIVARTADVLWDSGPGDNFKQHWVRAFARSVLRDEFGRYATDEVANPTTYGEATQRASDRLNALLEPHGVRVIQIITPKPKFEDQYEQAIEDRKVANQEVERLKINAIQLERERERRLADIERDMATNYEQLLGELEASRISAEKDRVQIEKSADAYKIKEVASGEARFQGMLQEANAKTEQARKEAEGLEAKVASLAVRGEVLVREALASKFAEIRFSVIPYQRDPKPVRIEHLGSVQPAPAGGKR